MKSFRIAFATVGLALVATPAIGQYYGTDGEQFVSAVEKRDGNKATELLAGHPTIVDTKDAKGDTGLIVAIRDSDNDWAAFLLNKGADPNAHGANGDTPLIAAAKVGFDFDVLIDAVDAGTGGATGRSKADAPEIDGEVHLRDAGGLQPGDIVCARIEDSDDHDLYGVPV